MAYVFKVLSQTGSKVSLEAASPDRDCNTTIYTHVPNNGDESLQLELDLFPLREGEEINFTPNAHIRICNIQPTIAPTQEEDTDIQPTTVRKKVVI
jgi:hypothetical protein